MAVETAAGCEYPPPPAGLPAATVLRVLDGGNLRARFPVSVAFDATPGDEALRAIARATGVSLEMPASAAAGTVTMALAGRPLEEILRRVLAALNLGGMALVYGPLGRITHVTLVEVGRTPSPVVPRRVPAPTARPRR